MVCERWCVRKMYVKDVCVCDKDGVREMVCERGCVKDGA